MFLAVFIITSFLADCQMPTPQPISDEEFAVAVEYEITTRQESVWNK